jgi:hypothetical protein
LRRHLFNVERQAAFGRRMRRSLPGAEGDSRAPARVLILFFFFSYIKFFPAISKGNKLKGEQGPR